MGIPTEGNTTDYYIIFVCALTWKKNLSVAGQILANINDIDDILYNADLFHQ